MYYPKGKELYIGQLIQWKLFDKWVDAIIGNLEISRDRENQVAVDVYFSKEEEVDEGCYSEDGVYVFLEKESPYIRTMRIKATGLARIVYPDAIETDGYLEI